MKRKLSVILYIYECIGIRAVWRLNLDTSLLRMWESDLLTEIRLGLRNICDPSGRLELLL